MQRYAVRDAVSVIALYAAESGGTALEEVFTGALQDVRSTEWYREESV